VRSPAQLANLRPFTPGNTMHRMHKGKLAAISRAAKCAPECVDYALSVMRDVEEPTKVRLAACKTLLELAIPSPKPVEVSDGTQLRFLEVVFVRPGEDQVANGKVIDAPANSFAITFDASDAGR
jgi:hypothetical protein